MKVASSVQSKQNKIMVNSNPRLICCKMIAPNDVICNKMRRAELEVLTSPHICDRNSGYCSLLDADLAILVSVFTSSPLQ